MNKKVHDPHHKARRKVYTAESAERYEFMCHAGDFDVWNVIGWNNYPNMIFVVDTRKDEPGFGVYVYPKQDRDPIAAVTRYDRAPTDDEAELILAICALRGIA